MHITLHAYISFLPLSYFIQNYKMPIQKLISPRQLTQKLSTATKKQSTPSKDNDDRELLALTEAFANIEKAIIEAGYKIMKLERKTNVKPYIEKLRQTFQYYCEVLEASKKARIATGNVQNKPIMVSTMLKVYVKIWYQHETLLLQIEEITDLLDA